MPTETTGVYAHLGVRRVRDDALGLTVSGTEYVLGLKDAEAIAAALQSEAFAMSEAMSLHRTICPGQLWTPEPGRRAFSREVVRMKTDPDGYPAVVYSHFWPNCGHTGTSFIRVDGFRAWIRKMRATMKESTDAI